MPLTREEKDILKALERRLNTVSFVVGQIPRKMFHEADLDEDGPLVQALNACRHDVRVVQLLDQL